MDGDDHEAIKATSGSFLPWMTTKTSSCYCCCCCSSWLLCPHHHHQPANASRRRQAMSTRGGRRRHGPSFPSPAPTLARYIPTLSWIIAMLRLIQTYCILNGFHRWANQAMEGRWSL